MDLADIQLDERSARVLETAIAIHVRTGQPVGSRTIAKESGLKLSAATIRNLMADLEEQELLSQPHTSAGRVPTDLAFRFYVDRLAALPVGEPLGDEELRFGLTHLHGEVPDRLEQVSRLLSRASHSIGLVIGPDLNRTVLRQIQFVRIGARRVLVVVVGASGLVHTRPVDTEREHEPEWLEDMSGYLTQRYEGWPLDEIRAELAEAHRSERAHGGPVARDSRRLARAFLELQAEERGIFVEGLANIVDDDMAGELERLRALVRALEDRGRLVELLDEFLKPGGVTVAIGSELPVSDMGQLSLVATRYQVGPWTSGALGVLGPVRMDYGRVVPLVDATARLVGELMTDYVQQGATAS